MKNTKPIAIRISNELMEAIIKIAKEEDRRPSYILGRFVSQASSILDEAFKQVTTQVTMKVAK